MPQLQRQASAPPAHQAVTRGGPQKRGRSMAASHCKPRLHACWLHQAGCEAHKSRSAQNSAAQFHCTCCLNAQNEVKHPKHSGKTL